MDFPTIELGPKMQALNERQRKFVWLYVHDDELSNTDAARLAGYPDSGGSSIRVRTHELMHSERVLEAIEEVTRQAVRGLVVPAKRAVAAMVSNSKHRDHAKTVLALLGSVGVGGQKVEVEVTLNHTDAALEALRILKDFGASREKLLEHFGHTGLSRYERMLNERESKQPQIIDGEVVK
jgi:hypothetical protein